MRAARWLAARRAFGCACALLVAGALACASPRATVEERDAYEQAVAVLPGDPVEGAARLEVFLQSHRESPLAEEAAFRRAQIALDSGDRAKAVFWLGWLVRNHPRGDRSDVARVKLSQLYLQTGDLEMGRRVLEDVRLRALSPEQERLVYRLRADLAEDRAERVGWLARARAAAFDSGVRAESLELIDAELTTTVDVLELPELERAFDLLDDRPPAGRVALRMAEKKMDQGEYAGAERDLRAAGGLALADADRTLLAELALRMELHEAGRGDDELLPGFAEVAELPVPPRSAAHGTLGVVLPLSGPYASYGEESLRGILLAAGIYGADVDLPETASPAARAAASEAVPARHQIRVLVRDGAGEPAQTAVAVRELAQLQEVVAILGPLRSSTAEAAAIVAEEEGVPLIALTTQESVTRDRPHVFRLRTTPEDELRYLVEHAYEKLGARRFAILYPEDGYGRGMRDEFWRMVAERGGWLVAAASYAPDATDYGSSIRELIGYSLLTPREESALVERENFLRRGRRLPPRAAALARRIAKDMIGPEAQPMPPIVDFDALFIPDDYEQIGLIAPALAFHEITGVQLLGAGDWYHPKLLELGREHVSGAVIAAIFDSESRFPFVADFVASYRAAFGTSPDAFSAHAWDAANLVLVQLSRGSATREAVREGVLRTQAYPGASGVTSLRPDGNARKRPFLLRVQGSRIVPLD
jgi:ABC-type branched-subunit amino acid transport system substrate-binding protein